MFPLFRCSVCYLDPHCIVFLVFGSPLNLHQQLKCLPLPCLGLSEPGGKLTDGVVAPGGNDVEAACASASPATWGLQVRGIVMGCKQNWKHVYDETSISELQWGSEQLTLCIQIIVWYSNNMGIHCSSIQMVVWIPYQSGTIVDHTIPWTLKG